MSTPTLKANLNAVQMNGGNRVEMNRMLVDHDDFDGGPEEDSSDSLSRKIAPHSQLAKYQAFICGTILLAWMLGDFGFSVAWVLLMAVAVHVIWWSSVIRLVEDSVQYEKLKVRRQKAILHNESAEWLNFIVNRWWILSSASVFARTKQLLEPLLNNAKPSILDSVVVKEFSLGNHTPSLGAIEAFEVINGRRRAMPLNSVANLTGLHSIRYRLAVEADVDLACPDFKMVLGLNSGMMGVDFVVTKLNIKGRVQLTFQFNADADFPHITKATVTFLQKPRVEFDADQKILRSSLKTWANNLFMNVLTDAMVDPFRLELNLAPENNVLPGKESNNRLAKGVLTVTLSLMPKAGKQSTNQDERWCTLKVGRQKHRTSCLPYRYSFLVESLAEDVLVIKVKANRFIGTHTLETFQEPLAVLNQDGTDSIDRNLSRGSVNMFLRLDYINLPPPPSLAPSRLPHTKANAANGLSEATSESSLTEAVEQTGESFEDTEGVLSGVLYICIHEAEGLWLDSCKSATMPNPYCVIIYNNKKVKTTHYISQSSAPRWDSGVELLVPDYSQVNFSIAVCNWDTNKMVESDFLGLATVSMASKKRKIIRQSLRLEQSSDSTTTSGGDSQCATVTVSVIFRPVPSVAHSGVVLHEDTCSTPPGGDEDFSTSGPSKKKASAPRASTGDLIRCSADAHPSLKLFLSATNDTKCSPTDISSTLASGHGLMEVSVIKALSLLAKDFNGYSDPYCEVKLNQDVKYKTDIKKKTLNPIWNERFIMQLPKDDDVFTLVVWDYDVFSRKDFLGSISLTLDDIQKTAPKETSEWYDLRETKSGSIELKFKIISEGLENTDGKSPMTETDPIRAETPTLQLSYSRPNFYGEDALEDQAVVVNGVFEPDVVVAVPNLPPKTRPTAASSKFETCSSTSTSTSSPQLSVRSLTAQSSSSNFSSVATDHQSRTGSNHTTSSSPQTSRVPDFKVIVPSPPQRKSSLPQSTPLPHLSCEADVVAASADDSSPAVSPIARGSTAYSSLFHVKRKVKKSFSQQLRRFRSEANVHEDKAKNFRVTIEKQDETYASCVQIDSLDNGGDTSPDTPTGDSVVKNSSDAANKNLAYSNIQGTVIQATGLELPKSSHISCRVRLLPTSHTSRTGKRLAKTLSKSKVIQSSPNPAFNLDFQADFANGVPASYSLVFDIRSGNKETVATKAITLQELFEDVIDEGDEMRTCLSLNTGATLEVVLSHGKESRGATKNAPQKKVSKLLRSWSVHRIGKI